MSRRNPAFQHYKHQFCILFNNTMEIHSKRQEIIFSGTPCIHHIPPPHRVAGQADMQGSSSWINLSLPWPSYTIKHFHVAVRIFPDPPVPTLILLNPLRPSLILQHPNILQDPFMTCSQLFHNAFTILSQLVHGLSIYFLKLLHNLLTTSSLVYKYLI